MSSYLKLNLNDLFKWCVTAIIWAIFTAWYHLVSSGTEFSLASMKTIAMAGLMAGLAYMAKNLITNSQGNLLQSESDPIAVLPTDQPQW